MAKFNSMLDSLNTIDSYHIVNWPWTSNFTSKSTSSNCILAYCKQTIVVYVCSDLGTLPHNHAMWLVYILFIYCHCDRIHLLMQALPCSCNRSLRYPPSYYFQMLVFFFRLILAEFVLCVSGIFIMGRGKILQRIFVFCLFVVLFCVVLCWGAVE